MGMDVTTTSDYLIMPAQDYFGFGQRPYQSYFNNADPYASVYAGYDPQMQQLRQQQIQDEVALQGQDIFSQQGMQGLARLAANPLEARNQNLSRLLSIGQRQQLAQQRMAGRQSQTFTPEAADLLGEGLSIDPTNAESHMAWLSKLNSNRNLLQDPRVYSMAAKINQNYHTLSSRPKTVRQVSPLESQLAELQVPDEEIDKLPRDATGAIDQRHGARLLGRAKQGEWAPVQLSPLAHDDRRELSDLASVVKGFDPNSDEAKKDWLTEKGIDPAKATVDQWKSAYNGVSQNQQAAKINLQALLQSHIANKTNVPPIFFDVAGMEPPTYGVSKSGKRTLVTDKSAVIPTKQGVEVKNTEKVSTAKPQEIPSDPFKRSADDYVKLSLQKQAAPPPVETPPEPLSKREQLQQELSRLQKPTRLETITNAPQAIADKAANAVDVISQLPQQAQDALLKGVAGLVAKGKKIPENFADKLTQFLNEPVE